MTVATAATLTGTFARLTASLEGLALKLARLERAVEAAGAQVDRATDAAREVGSAAEAVQQTLEMALAQPREEEAPPATPAAITTPREELLASVNGTPTADAPAPTLAPVVTVHPDGIATLEAPEGMSVDVADGILRAALDVVAREEEEEAPKGKRVRRRNT